MKILVLGASGMAGHVISTYLREKGHEVVPIGGRRKVLEDTAMLDLMDKQALEAFLKENTFDVIVNAVGMLIQQSEDRKDVASYLNGFLPHQLEYTFRDTKTKIIHLSTDCVFSGENGPYNEDSPYDGQTFYDRSKALGEIKNGKDLTLRMSIIGPDANPEGSGLFGWFYKQTGTIFGFTNAIWNGVTTIELAKAISDAIDQNLTGLYHLTPKTETISKYDLVSLFKTVFERNDITIEPKETKPTNKVLLNHRTDFDHEIPTYEQMIREMKAWIEDHKELYPHYEK